MKVTTWNRDKGFVSVILFENGTSAAVSTKVFKTQKGAEGANNKLKAICGEDWKLGNLPWQTTDPKDGSVTRHYRREDLRKF
jgi:hypothetical protein